MQFTKHQLQLHIANLATIPPINIIVAEIAAKTDRIMTVK
jgi:hypothetical protein